MWYDISDLIVFRIPSMWILKTHFHHISLTHLDETTNIYIYIWFVYMNFDKILWHLVTSSNMVHLQPPSKSHVHFMRIISACLSVMIRPCLLALWYDILDLSKSHATQMSDLTTTICWLSSCSFLHKHVFCGPWIFFQKNIFYLN